DLLKSVAFTLKGSLPGATFTSAAAGKAPASSKLDPVAIVASQSPGGGLAAKITTALDGDALSVRPIEVDVREVSFAPAPALLPAPAMLEGLAGKLGLKIGSLRYADPSSKNGQGAFTAKELELTAEVAPKKPLVAKLAAQVDAGPELGGGKLAANVSLPD